MCSHVIRPALALPLVQLSDLTFLQDHSLNLNVRRTLLLTPSAPTKIFGRSTWPLWSVTTPLPAQETNASMLQAVCEGRFQCTESKSPRRPAVPILPSFARGSR